MSWTLYKLSITLHCCIRSPHLSHFKTKVAYICIPKNHVNCIGLQHLMSYLLEFGMTVPFNESISFFLIRLDPWVLVPSPSEDCTSSPWEDYTSSPREDYTSSPSEGCTPSPPEDYMSSPWEGYTPSPWVLVTLTDERTTRPRLERTTRPHHQRATRPHL